jgi:hypothetical protein
MVHQIHLRVLPDACAVAAHIYEREHRQTIVTRGEIRMHVETHENVPEYFVHAAIKIRKEIVESWCVSKVPPSSFRLLGLLGLLEL